MKKLLLCDDSMLIRLQLKDFLLTQFNDLSILEARNGMEALSIYEEERPDLTILDIVMPEMDGLECLKRIRGINSQAKILILSSVGNKDILKESLKAGASNFIQKPWTEELIVQAVGQLL